MRKRDPQATEELRASLLRHARRLIERDGVPALTMRALAAEAGVAVGLPYKVFASREELVAQLAYEEFRRLSAELDRWVKSAGSGTVGGNLVRYARILLDSELPVWTLLGEVGDASLREASAEMAQPAGLVDSFEAAVPAYLAAERGLGRIAPDVDVAAFGFLITGAIHNLIIAPARFPRPSREKLDRMLVGIAARLA